MSTFGGKIGESKNLSVVFDLLVTEQRRNERADIELNVSLVR